MRIGTPHPRLGFLAAVILFVTVGLTVFATARDPAHSATITASYESGYLDVSINGYGTTGMGTFHLDDAGAGHVALCVEANERHSTDADAYAPVENRLHSAELDTLVWLIAGMPAIDSDTGVAAAALAWYFSGALRNIGVPVWTDGHRDFAPISPVDPERWDSLAAYDLSHLIGLRSEGVDLDTAERRVVELFDTITRLAGPWQLIDVDGRFQLTGPAGAISGHSVRIEARDHTGAPTAATDLVTDANGWVTPSLTSMPSGGSIHASTTSPGTHREWDGPGEVQRLVTATERPLSVDRRVPAQPGHLLVVKQSADPTIAVAGAAFELLDANQALVEGVVTADDGRATFAPVDPSVHPAPYTIREVSAPAGLLVSAPNQTLTVLSVNASEPTTAVMTDAPRTVPIEVIKGFSIEGIGPEDRSGFEFDLVRRSDGLTTRLVTDATGRSQRAEIALGDYTICEARVPEWAQALIDGGCVTLAITLDTIDEYDATVEPLTPDRPPYTVLYLNNVVAPSIITEAHDPADGDRRLASSGGSAVDVVTMTGLIPGTTYLITGELVPPGSTPWAAGEEGDHSTSPDADRVVSLTEFTAAQSSETHQVEFSIPAFAAGKYVIVERLWVGELVVAEHADLTDELQTIVIEPPVTTTTSTTTTTVPVTTVPVTTVPVTTVPMTTFPVTTVPMTTVPAGTPPPATPDTTTTTTPATTTVPPTRTTDASTSTTIAPPVVPRLPSTGAAGSTDQLVRLAEIALLFGVALIVITRLVPRCGSTNELF
jgi:hypothetical protein